MRTRGLVRTRYRTRRFSPPPSPSSTVTEIETGADTNTAVATPAVQIPTTAETGRPTDGGAAARLPTRPTSLTASEIEPDPRGPGETTPAAGGQAKNDNPPDHGLPLPPDPALPPLGHHTLSSPSRTGSNASGPSSRSAELSTADKALIEISNQNFFRRGREHEAAVAHRVACEVALERVKMHKRLGLRIDEWDEELALQGLPPLQRWRTLRPGGDVQEKENRRR